MSSDLRRIFGGWSLVLMCGMGSLEAGFLLRFDQYLLMVSPWRKLVAATADLVDLCLLRARVSILCCSSAAVIFLSSSGMYESFRVRSSCVRSFCMSCCSFGTVILAQALDRLTIRSFSSLKSVCGLCASVLEVVASRNLSFSPTSGK